MIVIPLAFEIYLAIALLYSLILGSLMSKISKFSYSFTSFFSVLSLSILTIILGFALILNLFSFFGPLTSLFLDQGFYFDKSSLFISLLISFFILVSAIFFYSYALIEFEIIILMCYSLIAMLVLVTTSDFIMAYLAVELQSLVFYVLAASNRVSSESTEAGLKYFLLGGFVSSLMLFGISSIYLSSGSVELPALFLLMQDGSFSLNSTLILGLSFFSVALLFKLSAFPFHSWTPDVYDGSPLVITAFFSVVPKLSILAFLTHLSYFVFSNLSVEWGNFLSFVSAFTIIIGTFGAIYQTRLKRLLAYSTISHVGFALLGVSTLSVSGFDSSIFYVVTYSLTNMVIFFILIGSYSKNSFHLETIDDLKNLSNSSPISAFSLSILLLSLAGVPPLAGFFSKYFILMSLIDSSSYTLAVIAVLLSVVSAYYYLRLIKFIFFISSDSWYKFSFNHSFSYIAALVLFLNLIYIFLYEIFMVALSTLFNF